VSVPPHTEVADSPPWWALIFTLVADGTLFASLIFGTLYLWISAPNWPPAATFAPDIRLAIAAIAALIVAAAASRGSLRSLVAGSPKRGWIGLAALGLLVAIAAAVTLIGDISPRPTEHALGATAAALLAYVALHAGIGLLFLLSNVLRLGAGFLSSRRSLDLRLTRLWLDYTMVTGVIALGLVLALPGLVGVLGARP
jgi:cytochrome c oxidase subunit I+III